MSTTAAFEAWLAEFWPDGGTDLERYYTWSAWQAALAAPATQPASDVDWPAIPKRGGKTFGERKADRVAAAAPQPEAQAVEAVPVAWLRNLTDPQPHAVTDLSYLSWADTWAGVKYVPVYTAPAAPAQQPLSDADITRIGETLGERVPGERDYESWGLGYRQDEAGEFIIPRVPHNLIPFARAIEAAHGIRSQP